MFSQEKQNGLKLVVEPDKFHVSSAQCTTRRRFPIGCHVFTRSTIAYECGKIVENMNPTIVMVINLSICRDFYLTYVFLYVFFFTSKRKCCIR